MSLDNIELKGEVEGTVTPDSRLSSNQIKMKQSSFRSIVGVWKKFRLATLNAKLNRMKNKLVSGFYKVDSNGSLTSSANQALYNNTEAVARLESTIKILSKENVPTDYVKSRAIKLRESMMKYMVYHSSNAYVILDRNRENVFKEPVSVPNPDIIPAAEESLASTAKPAVIDVEKVAGENKGTIAKEVESAMKSETPVPAVNVGVVPEEDQKPISREEIQNVVEDAFGQLDNAVTKISPEEVAQVVGESKLVVVPGKEPLDEAFDKIVAERKQQEADAVKTIIIPATMSLDKALKMVADEREKGTQTVIVEGKEPVEEALQKMAEQRINDDKNAVKTIIIPANMSLDKALQKVAEERKNAEANGQAIIVVGSEPVEKALQRMADERMKQDDNKAIIIPSSMPVEEAFKKIIEERKETSKALVPVSQATLGFEAPRKKLQEALETIVKESKVSKNGSAAAKTERFDSNGEEKETYEYRPMTDEEIARARENIEYDKYEKQYADEWAAKKARDEVVVAPEREVPEYQFTENAGIHFDYSDATPKDIANATVVENSRLGLEELKARVLALKEQKRQSESDLSDARSAQTEEAKIALDVRNATRAKRLAYEESLRKLAQYCETLEEETKVIQSSAAIARNDIECNRRFIQSHQAEMGDYDSKMKEIDSIISSDDEVAKRR